MQRRAIYWGTFGALLVRVVCAIFATALLQLPFVSMVGGLLLLWISHRMVVDEDGASKVKKFGQKTANLTSAIRTIVIADAIMGVDNIFAVAGAARGQVHLVVIGLLVSIPIIMWGSFIILHYIKRHPWLVWVGAALLGYTAMRLIADDLLRNELLAPDIWPTIISVLAGLCFYLEGWVLARRRAGRALPPDQDKSPV